MTIPVNLHSSLDLNVAQSNGVEPEISQFSISNLLPIDGDNKEISPSIDEFDKQEAPFQEFPEERKELTAFEFLQYWELPPPPTLEFPVDTDTHAEIDGLTLAKADNPTFLNPLLNNDSHPLPNDLEAVIEGNLSQSLGDKVIPLNDGFESEIQAASTPIVVQQQPHPLNTIDDLEMPLNPLVVEMKEVMPAEAISTANAFEPETHRIIAALITEKERGAIYSYQNVSEIKNQDEHSPDPLTEKNTFMSLPKDLLQSRNGSGSSFKSEDVITETKAALPFKLEDDVTQTNATPLFKPEDDATQTNATLSFKSEDVVAQTNAAPPLESQPIVNMDARIQQLTNHLNDFFNQSTTSDARPVSGADNFQSQFRMELLSLKPEILADHANYKTENYTAQINLHPAELGQISAKIEVNQGATTITFMAEHVHVQKLMEHHLAELHNAFQNSDLNLTSVNIHNGSAQDKNESRAYQRPEEEDDLNHRGASKKHISVNNGQRKNSIVDTYA